MIFLVDVNLPASFWRIKTHEFIFVSDINRELSDTEIGAWIFIIKQGNQLIFLK